MDAISNKTMEQNREKNSHLIKFITDFAKHAPATLFMALSSVIIAGVYTRIFNPQQYGIFSSIIAITGPVITILTEWVAQPVGRMYTEHKNLNKITLYWQTINTMIVSTCIVIILLSIIVSAIVISRFGHASLCLAACSVVLLQSITSMLLPVFPASFRAHLYRRFTIITVLLNFSITILLIKIFGKHIDFLLWAQALSLLLVLPAVIKQSGWKISLNILNPSPEIISIGKRMVTYGLPMMLWFLGSSLLDIGDRYVIQWFRGSTEVALYSVNYSLMAGIIMLLNVPVGVVLGPILFEQWNKRDIVNTEKTLSQMSNIYIGAAAGLVGLSSFIASALTHILIGKEFQVGSSFLIPVLFARAIWGLSLIGQKSLELQEKTSIMMYISVVSAIINLILNIVFIPKYGYVAAAYTTLISYFIYNYLIWLSSRRNIKWTIDVYQSIKVILAAGFAFFVTNCLVKFSSPILVLLTGTPIYIVTFAILFLGLEPNIRTQILKIARIKGVK